MKGITACLTVVMRITMGKIIALKDGGRSRKTDYSGFLRHRDVLLCSIAALVQWLVFRWEIAREDVPIFADCSSWYETKLLPGSLKEPEDDLRVHLGQLGQTCLGGLADRFLQGRSRHAQVCRQTCRSYGGPCGPGKSPTLY
jgi:hypothetical protein